MTTQVRGRAAREAKVEALQEQLSESVTALATGEDWKRALTFMRSGGIGPHYFKIGTRVLYRIDDVLAFEEQHMVITAGAA